MKIPVATAFLLLASTSAFAQEKASTANGSVQGITAVYNIAKANILKAAEQVPEDKYGFQPTKDVRTMGALFAHIADAQNFFCSQVSASPNQYSDAVEKTAKSKAELVAALKASFAKCDAAYAALTDADLTKPLNIFGNEANYAGALTLNASHDWEHYGNIVTYMRINGMVPPSSQ